MRWCFGTVGDLISFGWDDISVLIFKSFNWDNAHSLTRDEMILELIYCVSSSQRDNIH